MAALGDVDSPRCFLPGGSNVGRMLERRVLHFFGSRIWNLWFRALWAQLSIFGSRDMGFGGLGLGTYG